MLLLSWNGSWAKCLAAACRRRFPGASRTAVYRKRPANTAERLLRPLHADTSNPSSVTVLEWPKTPPSVKAFGDGSLDAAGCRDFGRGDGPGRPFPAGLQPGLSVHGLCRRRSQPPECNDGRAGQRCPRSGRFAVKLMAHRCEGQGGQNFSIGQRCPFVKRPKRASDQRS